MLGRILKWIAVGRCFFVAPVVTDAHVGKVDQRPEMDRFKAWLIGTIAMFKASVPP